MRLRPVLLLGSAAIVALAGCSTSTSSPSTTSASPSPTFMSASPSQSESPTATETTNVLPPVEIDGTKTTVAASVGDALDITMKGVTKVSTDNAEVLKVSQPHSSGGAEFNAGAEVLAPGTAKLMIETDKGETTVTVNVSD